MSSPLPATPVTLKIAFKAENLPQLIERYGIDFGSGGMFLRTNEPLEVGTKVLFEFRLQKNEVFLEGSGTVLWQRSNEEIHRSLRPGMGIGFDVLSLKSHELVLRIIKQKSSNTDRFSEGFGGAFASDLSLPDGNKYDSKETPKIGSDDDDIPSANDMHIYHQIEPNTPELSYSAVPDSKQFFSIPAYPTSAIMRNLIRAFFPLDTDFDAYCIDYYPSVYDKFSGGMDRVSKTNILLVTVDLNDMLSQLRAMYRGDRSKLRLIDNHLASLDTEEKRQLAALQLQLKDLTIKRERRVANGNDSAELDQQMVALKRQLRQVPQLQCGEILNDRYELLEVIGKGGFARVWQVFDHREGRLVAAKILHSEASDEPRRIERFVRGALQMKNLRHTHIVRVLDGPSEHLGFRYFIMDYYAGGDLSAAVAEGKITQKNALIALLDIDSALTYSHQRKIIHRDVKPENILLDRHGQAFLSDFDLAWVADTTGGTRTGFLGSYVYVPLEQAEDAKSVDERADVYALGMTVIFVLHGKPLPHRVVRQRALFIDSLHCSEAAKQLLRHATADDAEDRPQTVAAFCGALTAALAKR